MTVSYTHLDVYKRQRFYRADGARAGTGAGLGLAIVRELMQRMGGTAGARLDGDVLTITLHFRGA